MRANVDAFRRRALRPRMLVGTAERDISVEVLGLHSPAPFLLAPVGVLSIVHADAERAVAGASKATGVPLVLSSAASTSLEDVAAIDPPRWFQLYWWGDRGARGEPRPAGRGGRLRRDRPHRRHADARLAAARPPERLSAVPQGGRAWAVLLRRGVPRPARVATRGEPRHRLADGPLGVPEPRAHVGRPRAAPWLDVAADPAEGRGPGRRCATRARARYRRDRRLEPRRPPGRRLGRRARRPRRGARGGRAPTRSC